MSRRKSKSNMPSPLYLQPTRSGLSLPRAHTLSSV